MIFKPIQIFNQDAGPLSLRLTDQQLEKEFWQSYINQNLRQVQLTMVLGSVLYSLATGFEIIVFDLTVFHLIRMITVAGAFLIGLSISIIWPVFYKRYYKHFNVFYVLLSTFSLIHASIFVNEEYKLVMYSGLYICLIFNFTIIRQDFIRASLTGLLVMVVFVLALRYGQTPATKLIHLSIYFMGAQLLGMFVAYYIELENKTNFLMLKQIRIDSQKIRHSNEDLSRLIREKTQDLRKAKDLAEENAFFLRESQRAGNIGSFRLDASSWIFNTTETLDKMLGIDQQHPKTLENWYELIHPDDKAAIIELSQSYIFVKKKAFTVEFRIFRNDNKETRWILSNSTPLFDEAGKLTHVLGTVQDISEQKRMEEERTRMNLMLESMVKERTAQLNQANKDLESFAYSISHDLRAPIRHIDGFLNLACRNLNPGETKAKDYLDKVSRSSQRMSELIDSLLQFSRLGRATLVKGHIQLSEMIETIIQLLEPDCAHRKIKWDIKDLPAIYGDPALISIAFENLLSNAIKYTSKRELAIIEIGQSPSPGDELIKIYIKDNGAGFDMKYRDKLFEVFKRLHMDNEFEGTGIGLANVKQIINRHQGEVDAEAEPDKGACFYITLPIAPKE